MVDKWADRRHHRRLMLRKILVPPPESGSATTTWILSLRYVTASASKVIVDYSFLTREMLSYFTNVTMTFDPSFLLGVGIMA
jgi:hypothetical protein